jgi:hypothetical protein
MMYVSPTPSLVLGTRIQPSDPTGMRAGSDRRSPPGGVLRILLVANSRPREERKERVGAGLE